MRQSRNVLIPATALMLALCQIEDLYGRDRVVVDRRADGYRLIASNKWSLTQKLPQGGSVIRMETPPCMITVISTPMPGVVRLTLTDLTNLYSQTGAQYASRKFVRQRVETHQGKPSGWIEFTGELKKLPGLVLRFREFFTVHRGRIYTINVSAPDKSWRKSAPHWRKVIDSMEFLY